MEHPQRSRLELWQFGGHRRAIADDDPVGQGTTRRTMAAASVYAACRCEALPRTVADIEAVDRDIASDDA